MSMRADRHPHPGTAGFHADWMEMGTRGRSYPHSPQRMMTLFPHSSCGSFLCKSCVREDLVRPPRAGKQSPSGLAGVAAAAVEGTCINSCPRWEVAGGVAVVVVVVVAAVAVAGGGGGDGGAGTKTTPAKHPRKNLPAAAAAVDAAGTAEMPSTGQEDTIACLQMAPAREPH